MDHRRHGGGGPGRALGWSCCASRLSTRPRHSCSYRVGPATARWSEQLVRRGWVACPFYATVVRWRCRWSERVDEELGAESEATVSVSRSPARWSFGTGAGFGPSGRCRRRQCLRRSRAVSHRGDREGHEGGAPVEVTPVAAHKCRGAPDARPVRVTLASAAILGSASAWAMVDTARGAAARACRPADMTQRRRDVMSSGAERPIRCSRDSADVDRQCTVGSGSTCLAPGSTARRRGPRARTASSAAAPTSAPA